MPNLIFFHGFLGCPEDWDEVITALPSSYDCFCPDLSKEIPQNLEKSCCIIGYSMGGRIALELFPEHPLILIGANLGLQDQTHRIARIEQERKWIERLIKDPHEFLNDWYMQPLFSSLKQNQALFARVEERRKKIDPTAHAELLSRFSLGKQPFFNPPKNALFLFGERDQKFANLYGGLTNACAIPQAGHAAHLENPVATAMHIRTYLEKPHARNCDS